MKHLFFQPYSFDQERKFFFFESVTFVKLRNIRSFMVHSCSKSEFAKYVRSGAIVVNDMTSI